MSKNSLRLITKATIGGLFGILSLFGVAVIGKLRFENDVRIHVNELLSTTYRRSNDQFLQKEVTTLPTPVRQYFEHVLREGQPYIRTVHLRQSGKFRLGDSDPKWRSFTASQHFTTQPPGFVWVAKIDIFPLLPACVVDLFKRGEGLLRATLLGLIPVASAGPNPELNESELVRYLAEAVWFPTALLPTQGVKWEPIDEHSARATIENEDVTASLVFYFDEQNEVAQVTTERYRQEENDYATWTGYFREYEEHHGVRIPTEAEVKWELPEGDLPYWRAVIEDITYQTAQESLH